MEIKKIIFDEFGNKYFWKEKDLHTKYGTIKEEDILRKKEILSNKNKKFYITEPNFRDQIEKIKRGPPIVLPKDIGIIITYTGVGEKSKIVDAGSGSGMLCCYLARVVGKLGKVITYEKNNEFCKIVEKNIKDLNLENIKVKNKDIYEGISEKNLDLITLDLPEPWNVLEHAKKSLKCGAFLVTYLPTINQVKETVEKSDGFIHIKTIELLERKWFIEKNKIRPSSKIIAHTSFLSFFRKI